MEEQTVYNNQPHDHSSHPVKKKSFPWLLFLFIFFLVGIGLGIYFTYTPQFQQFVRKLPFNTTQKNPQTITKETIKYVPQKIEFWQKPESTKKGFPIVNKDSGDLYIYNLATKQVKDAHKAVDPGYAGASGFGENIPLVSPDALYSVFIDKENENLWLLAHETLEAQKISDQKVDYITSWSTDSTKIIYHVGAGSIRGPMEGPGPGAVGKRNFEKGLLPGFHMFDIEKGETTYLYNLEAVENFIDHERVLVPLDNLNEKYAVFNTNTFEADYSVVKDKYGFCCNQFSFTADGKLWAFTNSPQEGEMQVQFSPFAQKDGKVIDSGSYAEVQQPHFSPDGKKIAYLRHEGEYREGYPKQMVWIYNVETGAKNKFTDGYRIWWIDDTKIIMEAYENVEKNTRKYYLLDITSGKTESIYPQQ